MASVGTLVVASVSGLALGIPRSLTGDLVPLLTTVAAFALLGSPFDWLGGWVLPRRYGRFVPSAPRFAQAWLRGVFVQGVVMVGAGWLVLQAGRSAGVAGSVGAVLVLQVLVLLFLAPLARLVAALPRREVDVNRFSSTDGGDFTWPRIQVLAARDPGFTGGITGPPGRETLVAPAAWLAELPEGVLHTQLVRRLGAIRTGSRTRGLLLALTWNMAGFVASLGLPGASVTTASGLTTAWLGFVLWSFVGLLILPAFSRTGVYAVDSWARRNGVTEAQLSTAMFALDRRQDDEPSRPRGVEAVFHPVPSVENRRAGREGGAGFWHAARTALPLSWVCGGFLSRAVHGNCGRPELWVLLPTD